MSEPDDRTLNAPEARLLLGAPLANHLLAAGASFLVGPDGITVVVPEGSRPLNRYVQVVKKKEGGTDERA